MSRTPPFPPKSKPFRLDLFSFAWSCLDWPGYRAEITGSSPLVVATFAAAGSRRLNARHSLAMSCAILGAKQGQMRQPLSYQIVHFGGPIAVIKQSSFPVRPSEAEAIIRKCALVNEEGEEPRWGLEPGEDGVMVIDADGSVIFRYMRVDFERERQTWGDEHARRT
jgi:hypothetical protein